MPSFSAHYCEGDLAVCFVFSAPGKEEYAAGRPVAGDTGKNLDSALRYLNCVAPEIFASPDRYAYRITNAFSKPLAIGLGHKRTEASKHDILAPANIARVRKETVNCSLLVLCGKKAQLLSSVLANRHTRVVHAYHVGNKALNVKFKLEGPWTAATARERRQQRARMWAELVLRDVRCAEQMDE